MMTCSCGKAFCIKPSDRFYITLPMYHSSAGILATGQVLTKGFFLKNFSDSKKF